MAYAEIARCADNLVTELFPHSFMNEDALHGDTELPIIQKGPTNATRGGQIEIGVFIHDHGAVSAEFESHSFQAGVRADPLAGGNASRKRDHCDARVANQHPTDIRSAGHDVI